MRPQASASAGTAGRIATFILKPLNFDMAYVPTRLKPISSATTFSTGCHHFPLHTVLARTKLHSSFQASRNGYCASLFTGFLISHPVSEISADKRATFLLLMDINISTTCL